MDGANSETARLAPPPSTQDAAIVADAAVELHGTELRCVGTWTVAHLVAIERWVEGPPTTVLERAPGEQGPAELTPRRAAMSWPMRCCAAASSKALAAG